MNPEKRTKKTLLKENERLRQENSSLKARLAEWGLGPAGVVSKQAFQESILDGVADPIMVIGQDYRVQLMNRAARQFSARDAGPTESTLCYEISHQRDTPCNGIEHPCPLEQVRATRQQVTVLHEHAMADGEKRLLEIIASPYWGPDNSFQGIVESMRDVTERIRAKNELQVHADRIRALATQITEVAETERQRLARELHDLVGQNLSALAINLNIVQTQLTGETGAPVRHRIEDSLSLVEETTDRIRDVMTRLRPPILDDCGLVAALKWYADKFTQRTGIAVTVVHTEPEPRMVTRVENALFRIAQEALTNVAKHAQATTVSIHVEHSGDQSRLVIADNGIGFTPRPILQLADSNGWGLLTMNERAEAVGGVCRIESAPDQGTRVIVEIPR